MIVLLEGMLMATRRSEAMGHGDGVPEFPDDHVEDEHDTRLEAGNSAQTTMLLEMAAVDQW